MAGNQRIAKLAVLAASSVLGFVFLECSARLFYEVPPTWHDPQIRHVHSPLLGWALPVSDESFTIDVPVTTNSIGLREDEIPIQKPPGELRVLALGDSFTFALGVAFEDLYVQKLERLLQERYPDRAVQVINAGVAGYNSRQELLYLMAEGLALEPDLITTGFYWNDLIGNGKPLPDLATTPIRGATESKYDPPREHLLPAVIRDTLRQSVALYLVTTQVKSLLRSRDTAINTTFAVQQAVLNGDREFLEEFWQETGVRLIEIADLGARRDIPVVLMAFPMENQIRGDFPNAEFASRLEEIWKPTGMPFIDLEPIYRDSLAKGVNPFLPYDLHPSPAGMALAAAELFEVIQAQRWFAESEAEARGRP